MADASEASAWIGVIGAGIGAGASVLTQVISNFVAGKRELQRIELDKRRFHHESESRARELVYESKRLAYVRALELAHQAREVLAKIPVSINGLSKDGKASFDAWVSEWRKLQAEVDLLDDSLKPYMWKVLVAFHAWTDQLGVEHMTMGFQLMSDADTAIDDMKTAMRQSLVGK